MPRSVRIEYSGAVYHVMCRGDRRETIAQSDADWNLYEKTMGEVCARTGFIVHAYVLMPNHYHMLLETPEANLVAGMKWFQGTYTQRYNARHRLCGHLFQGRYKAVVIEADEPRYFRMVSDYIHLNPARAGLLGKERPDLGAYRWSSYPCYIAGGKERRAWLQLRRVLSSLGIDGETRKGRSEYRNYMARRVREIVGTDLNEDAKEEWQILRRGWYIGSEAFRNWLYEKVDGVVKGRKRNSYEGGALVGHDAKRAEELLGMGLKTFGMSLEEIRQLRKQDERKQGIAWLIKVHTVVGDDWICERLAMGDRSNISRAIQEYRTPIDRLRKRLKILLHKCTD